MFSVMLCPAVRIQEERKKKEILPGLEKFSVRLESRNFPSSSHENQFNSSSHLKAAASCRNEKLNFCRSCKSRWGLLLKRVCFAHNQLLSSEKSFSIKTLSFKRIECGRGVSSCRVNAISFFLMTFGVGKQSTRTYRAVHLSTSNWILLRLNSPHQTFLKFYY